METKTTRAKRKMTPAVVPHAKKPRSRRRRSPISPVLNASLNSVVTDQTASSISCLYSFGGENSCDSGRDSVGSALVKLSNTGLRKREFSEIRSSGDHEEFRRVTRSYYKKKKEEIEGSGDAKVEVSESSRVESCSGAERGLNLKGRSGRGGKNVKEIGGDDGESDAITRIEISCRQQFSPESAVNFGEFSEKKLIKETRNLSEIKASEVISVTSGVDSPSEVKLQNVCSSSVMKLLSDRTINCDENRALATEFSEISRDYVESSLTVPNSESTIEQKPNYLEFDPNLACTEQFSYNEVSDYSLSHETTFSELQCEIFPESSDLDFSCYSPSIFFESGSEFSERSGEDSSPSQTYSLFLEYREQFSRSTSPFDVKVSSHFEGLYNHDLTLLRFEDEEDEDSYRCFRSRERRQMYLRDYAAEYCATTEYGDLITQQRFQMIHWIIEQSAAKELHKETLFLGVSLMDRFLSLGFFKRKRNLQIIGIACLTLATRIEENQPFNSVRQRTFYVGVNTYSRCEVVAMEWLVQEVLSFQCLLPSIYNFLWFYLKAARASAEMEKTAKNLAERALLGHEHLNYWPSTVAASLVILVAMASNQSISYHRVMETHIRTKDDDLHDCTQSLQWLMKYVP